MQVIMEKEVETTQKICKKIRGNMGKYERNVAWNYAIKYAEKVARK